MSFTKHSLQYLICISCRSENLKLDQSGSTILCSNCGAVYKVVNGVPSFVPDELLNFSEVVPDEWENFLQMKKVAYSGSSFIGRMYNNYHLFASARRLADCACPKTVDIGFGIGEHYPFISEKEKAGTTYIGIDFDRTKLEHFNSCHPEVPVLQASVFNLPIADNSMEFVQLLATLEHFTSGEIDRLLDEALRILKPDGRLITCYPAEGGIMLKICQKLMHLFLKTKTGFDLGKGEVHHHLSTALEIRALLSNRSDLVRVETFFYPINISSINLALFVNEQYRKVK